MKNISQKKVIIPDFYIIGAPRAGTTSLYKYLDRSKKIEFFPEHSELFRKNYKKNTIFKKNENNSILYGEVNPYYLYDAKVPELIHQYNPGAKFVIIIRDPIERAISHHCLKYRKGEEIFNFKDSIRNEQTINKSSENIVKRIYGLLIFPYLKLGYYEEQIKRYLKYFKGDQFYFKDFNDFSNNTKEVVLEIAEFLNINGEDIVKAEFIKYNAAKSSGYVYRLKTFTFTAYIIRIFLFSFCVILKYQSIEKFILTIMRKLSLFMYKFNKKSGKPKNIDQFFYKYLENIFKEKNQNLRSITGLSNISWLK